MLVLSRKQNEAIVIDDRIVVRVVEIRGDKIRLGIEAPREVPIHRLEVHEAIQQEEAAATQLSSPAEPTTSSAESGAT
jgi:carbon storage regulator